MNTFMSPEGLSLIHLIYDENGWKDSNQLLRLNLISNPLL
jgi:hypothetical protein